jgi:hypothetical protein
LKSLSAAVLATSLALATGHAAARAEPSPIAKASADAILGKPYAGPKVATPRDAKGKPLLTGYWKLLHEDGKPDGNFAKDQPGLALPYTTAGKAALAANYKVIDPEARCLITGQPRLLTSVLPFEILQTPNRLATFHQLSWHRFVWTDGRAADPDPEPRYLGNALGTWDGDTLVITSTGFQDSAGGKIWLDDNANPISGQARLIERWSRPDFHHLNLEATLIDPAYYSKPITYRRSFVAAPAGEHLKEFSCEWNSWWVLNNLEPGPGEIGPDGNRGFGPDGQITPTLPLGAVEGSRGTAYWLYRTNKAKPSDLPKPR